MRFFNSMFAAVSTYSVIPVPGVDWEQNTTRYAICFFPVVGLICGGALAVWFVISGSLGMDSTLFAAVAACIPLLLTGGIHMDGYMDTVDAISSHQSRERKLEILKDPNCGAFAVIYCGIYMLIQLGLFSALFPSAALWAVCPGYVLSRGLSAINVVTLPNARGTGMLSAFTDNVHKRAVIIASVLFCAIAIAAMVVIAPIPGAFAAAFGLLSLPLYRLLAIRQFGGATGDTAGFFLQICELCIMLGAWIGGLI
ncbi:MAG: adenosylcobinamide-GDP ribazoletransferase [Oscillospiraceae bacterium]|nr:adenosylcobinamide-GDP ribazoletransferase [Oscillospiraceae bacterium]